MRLKLRMTADPEDSRDQQFGITAEAVVLAAEESIRSANG